MKGDPLPALSEGTPADHVTADQLAGARAAAAGQARQLGLPHLADDARLVVSELVTNAVLHGGGCLGVRVVRSGWALRIEVRDANPMPPVLGWASENAMTGRGMRLVSSLAIRWGVDATEDGKVVWAEMTGDSVGSSQDESELLARWDERQGADRRAPRYQVELGEVPTGLLLAAKSHIDNLVREFSLAASGADSGLTAEIPPHLAHLIETVVGRFAEARLAIKYQALAGLHRNASHIRLRLDLPVEAADAALDYVNALDEVDNYCRAMRFLTLETPPQHRVFRRWYIEELVRQLRSAASGQPTPPPQTFEQRLLQELDQVAQAHRASERAARLYRVAMALAGATTPEAVAEAVITEGQAALGASGSGLLLATNSDHLAVPATVGYDDQVVSALRRESPDAELPAAAALRTGEPVWLESRLERDERFPELVGLEATTVSLCAVPLIVPGRRLGALRFSFTEARLFDEDERQFVMALAAQSAQALDRAQLQQARVSVSRRLQRSLLPPRLPAIPGVEVAALYHPFGDEVDVGGDFYDIWALGSEPGQWAVAIGDASGTGPEAAALTALVRFTLRALTMTDRDPGSVLKSLNQALLAYIGDSDSESFCTVTFGILTVSADGVVLDLASGGHPYPILWQPDGSMSTIRVGGSLLGQFDSIEIARRQVHLHPGNLFLVYTDGVVEGRSDQSDGAFFDTGRIRQVLADSHHSATEVVTALGAAVVTFSGGRLHDDVAAVALRILDPPNRPPGGEVE